MFLVKWQDFQNSNANSKWFWLRIALTNFNEFSCTYFWLIWNMMLFHDSINKSMHAWRIYECFDSGEFGIDFAKWQTNMQHNTVIFLKSYNSKVWRNSRPANILFFLLKRHICKTVFPLLFTKTFSEELISFDMVNDYAKTNFLLTQVWQEMPKNL